MTEQRNQSIPGAPARAECPDTGRRRLLSAGVAALSAATIGTGGWLGAAGRARAQAAATAPKARIASLTFDYRGLSRRGIAVMQDEIAAIAGAMPKSGYAANSQGKACAAAALCEHLLQHPGAELRYLRRRRLTAGGRAYRPGAGCGRAVAAGCRRPYQSRGAEFAIGWFRNITADTFT